LCNFFRFSRTWPTCQPACQLLGGLAGCCHNAQLVEKPAYGVDVGGKPASLPGGARKRLPRGNAARFGTPWGTDLRSRPGERFYPAARLIHTPDERVRIFAQRPG